MEENQKSLILYFFFCNDSCVITRFKSQWYIDKFVILRTAELFKTRTTKPFKTKSFSRSFKNIWVIIQEMKTRKRKCSVKVAGKFLPLKHWPIWGLCKMFNGLLKNFWKKVVKEIHSQLLLVILIKLKRKNSRLATLVKRWRSFSPSSTNW